MAYWASTFVGSHGLGARAATPTARVRYKAVVGILTAQWQRAGPLDPDGHGLGVEGRTRTSRRWTTSDRKVMEEEREVTMALVRANTRPWRRSVSRAL